MPCQPPCWRCAASGSAAGAANAARSTWSVCLGSAFTLCGGPQAVMHGVMLAGSEDSRPVLASPSCAETLVQHLGYLARYLVCSARQPGGVAVWRHLLPYKSSCLTGRGAERPVLDQRCSQALHCGGSQWADGGCAVCVVLEERGCPGPMQVVLLTRGIDEDQVAAFRS